MSLVVKLTIKVHRNFMSVKSNIKKEYNVYKYAFKRP